MTPRPRFPSSVRLPSHIDPPFKARSWCCSSRTIISTGFADPGIAFCSTRFSGSSFETFIPGVNPEPVPDGMRAEVTWIEAGAIDLSGVILTATPENIALNVRKGTGSEPPTQAVPGFIRAPMNTTFRVTAGAISISLDLRQSIVSAPLHLTEGESAQLFVAMYGAALAATWILTARWGGFLYALEVEGEAGTIRETAQDPGIRDPLGR